LLTEFGKVNQVALDQTIIDNPLSAFETFAIADFSIDDIAAASLVAVIQLYHVRQCEKYIYLLNRVTLTRISRLWILKFVSPRAYPRPFHDGAAILHFLCPSFEVDQVLRQIFRLNFMKNRSTFSV